MIKINSIYLLYLVFFIGACQTNSAPPKQAKPTNQTKENTLIESHSEITVTTSQLYTTGNATHFTDSCQFYFECDCCAGDLILNSDSTFYSIDYCMADQSVSYGTYSKSADNLTLFFSGICVSKVYNWENEVDSSVVDYFINDTVYKAFSVKFDVKNCNDHEMLVHQGENSNEIAIETQVYSDKPMSELVDRSILNKIKGLENALHNPN